MKNGKPGAAEGHAGAGLVPQAAPGGVPAKVGTVVLPRYRAGIAGRPNPDDASPNPVDYPSHLPGSLTVLPSLFM
jgi:hypothetical protein